MATFIVSDFLSLYVALIHHCEDTMVRCLHPPAGVYEILNRGLKKSCGLGMRGSERGKGEGRSTCVEYSLIDAEERTLS